MIRKKLDCESLRRSIDLEDAGARPDLIAVDSHLRACVTCHDRFFEVALLRGIGGERRASKGVSRGRVLVAAAALVVATLALHYERDAGSPSGVSRSRPTLAAKGRVRMLPTSVSSVTTTVTSASSILGTRLTRTSTTSRTLSFRDRDRDRSLAR